GSQRSSGCTSDAWVAVRTSPTRHGKWGCATHARKSARFYPWRFPSQRQMTHHQCDALHRPRRRCRRQGGGRQQTASQERRVARFSQAFVTKILLQERFLQVRQAAIAPRTAVLEQDPPDHILHTLSALQGEIEVVKHGLARRDSPQGEQLPLIDHESILER